MIARVSEEVARLPADALRQLYPVLHAARQELEHDLAQWLRTVDTGAQRFTAHHLRAMLRQVREAMRVIKTLQPAIATTLTDTALAAAGLSNVHIRFELIRLTAMFGDQLPILDLPVAVHLLDEQRWLLGRYQRAASRYTARSAAAIRAQLARGVAKGESIDQMARRLLRLRVNAAGTYRLAELGADGLAQGMAEGLFQGRLWDAERLVRTEAMNAYNAFNQQSIARNGLLKRWDASPDRHCTLCHELDGELRQPDEPFSSGHFHPPYHPNCRCIVIPWSPDWPEVQPLKSGPAAPVVTRSGTARETNRIIRERTTRRT